jgi:hypothetical protein
LARWAGKNRRFPVPQGVALGWANGWAFGPIDGNNPSGPIHVKILPVARRLECSL